MKYIAVEKAAALEIVGDRLFQSYDFAEGQNLARVLSGEAEEINSARVRAVRTSSGVLLLAGESAKGDYIVFDLAQAPIFASKDDPQGLIQCLQKTLRFAIKFWSGNSVFTAAERIIHEANRAVIFPFPISQSTGFRVVIDLSPDAARRAKRDQSSRFLLVFYAGTDDRQDEVSPAVFRRFQAERDGLSQADIVRVAAGNQAAPLTVTALDEIRAAKVDIHQSYDNWMHLVTDQQRQFIETPLTTPSRIEGPAGTGKTLCLCLKAFNELLRAETEGRTMSAIFLTHSEATRQAADQIFLAMGADRFLQKTDVRRTLSTATLQSLCDDILGQDIQDTEFLDRDALEAKNTQLLMIDEAVRKAASELASFRGVMSPQMVSLIESEDSWTTAEMFQHEIAVIIKGRANQNYESYKRASSLSSGLPIRADGDKAFCWRVFSIYDAALKQAGQFDTDDVVISAHLHLSAPIWRRRRLREGYDALFIDETHLFNMNELSVFSAITRAESEQPIAFAVDRSQAVGDRGWNEDIDIEALIPDADRRADQKYTSIKAVFRSSPQIVNLAFTITSSGAQLFTNFHDPLDMAYSIQTIEDERRSSMPCFLAISPEQELVDVAFSRAERMAADLGVRKGDIAIIFFDEALFKDAKERALAERKPVAILSRRGDAEIVKRAQAEGKVLISLPDYVGGLEFAGVILVGVDKGRVPASTQTGMAQSRAYLEYVAHNRLYVAITRARYRVEILGVRDRGMSPFVSHALERGALEEVSL